MPGMAASSQIFEYLRLPKFYLIHKLDWIIPNSNETLELYSKRICKKINKPDPILIGVSFGGILIQEISKHLSYKKIVIISSIKTSRELPLSMKMAKKQTFIEYYLFNGLITLINLPYLLLEME